QARSQYFPLRYRNPELALNLADTICKNTGYEEFSLSGLSVSDYPRLEELLNRLTGLFKPKGVAISLPSIKASYIMGSVSSLIAKFKKTGLTFAPEAGSQALRNLLAKDFDSESFFNTLKEAYECSYQHVKLYFMIGIPYEKDGDLDAIIEFASKVSDLRRKTGKPSAMVNISINALIPKPHTALQWFPMQTPEGIKYKQDYIKGKSIQFKKFKISFHNLNMSFLEGVLSRGDRKLSEVILSAFNKGARFDAWSSYFKFDLWESSFKELGIDPLSYLSSRRVDELLPWDFIDTGIDRGILAEEFKKTIAI
ncbi:MAG: B12-binding domain-containing radical SAM protein, partial [Candidatus Omnitrophica bacterium]|nr:B12-binding domain-containing radical SAM protein [Candidatus Omnitrophota bacterium]